MGVGGSSGSGGGKRARAREKLGRVDKDGAQPEKSGARSGQGRRPRKGKRQTRWDQNSCSATQRTKTHLDVHRGELGLDGAYQVDDVARQG